MSDLYVVIGTSCILVNGKADSFLCFGLDEYGKEQQLFTLEEAEAVKEELSVFNSYQCEYSIAKITYLD